MNKLTIAAGLTASLLLVACGSDPEPDATATPERETQVPDAAPELAFIDDAGRWTTAPGAVAENTRVVIDIASNGRFTMDVRKQGAAGEAVTESAKGAAVKKGEQIAGTLEAGAGVHQVLEAYPTWTINTATGRLYGPQGNAVQVAKE